MKDKKLTIHALFTYDTYYIHV